MKYIRFTNFFNYQQIRAGNNFDTTEHLQEPTEALAEVYLTPKDHNHRLTVYVNPSKPYRYLTFRKLTERPFKIGEISINVLEN